ncbi:hypothetical protein CKA38_10550 [Ereboglobus luteus]|uniref:Uncharacterized protein n=2 Tax=Ereboglobus luteus TaxID=1796921 RepID=A0A2U8E3Y8_9BACT|nr:hypothetical protein CKA38_10550 [Ereboglobus luteus]
MRRTCGVFLFYTYKSHSKKLGQINTEARPYYVFTSRSRMRGETTTLMNIQNNKTNHQDTPARASASDEAFFADPIDPKVEARAMTLEALTHVLLWISEGSTLVQRGLRSTIVLRQVRPDLIGGMTLEEIGEQADCTRQTIHKLADDFRKSMGLAL